MTMNLRISELVTATDAWCDQNLPSNWTDDVDKYLPVWNQKFAELIVWECFLIGSKYIQTNNDVSKFEKHLKRQFRRE